MPGRRSMSAPILKASSEDGTAYQHTKRLSPISDADGEADEVGVFKEKYLWPQIPRTHSMKILAWIIENLKVVALACVLAAGSLALCIFGAIHDQKRTAPPPSVCLTPGCVLAAAELLNNISPTYEQIDPCDDFRTYVCGGWDLKHDLRADQGGAFTGTIMRENSELLLRHILEAPFPQANKVPSVDEQNFGKLQDAYGACMDETKIKKKGSAPLLDLLFRIEELFPAGRPHSGVDTFVAPMQQQKSLWYSRERELSNTIAYMMSIGVESMLSFMIAADDKDPDAVALFLTAPRRPGLPSKEYYSDKAVVQSYSKTIGQVLEALLQEAGPNSTFLAKWREQTPKQGGLSTLNEGLVQSVVDFESKLAENTPETEDDQDVTKYYNPRSLEETGALIPQISIRYLISKRTSDVVPDKIIVGSPLYLKALSKILSSTSKETIQAYLVWKTVQTYARHIEDEAIKPLKRFENQIQGKDPEVSEERWRTCVKHVDRSLGWILSRFYVQKTFSKDAKHLGDVIVSDIKKQFIEKLNRAEWMSESVRKLGVEKVHNIVQKIGYPTRSPDIESPYALQNYYASVNITDSEFFANALSIAGADVNREWAKLGKPTDRDEWDIRMTVPTVNAYYNPPGNEIVFPAGIMQAPVFYDPKVPQYLSYGAFGSVSGHELSHAFDSTGRHYDPRGNFTGWWDNATVLAFKDKAQCFVDQYHNFTVPGVNGERLHVNGRLTLGENIADAGGLSASFAAWKQREKDDPSELLPGLLQFTKEQLFFISYGNWWCGKTRKEELVNRIYNDPHSPEFARILGTMQNSRDFRESFNCPQREPTCEMW